MGQLYHMHITGKQETLDTLMSELNKKGVENKEHYAWGLSITDEYTHDRMWFTKKGEPLFFFEGWGYRALEEFQRHVFEIIDTQNLTVRVSEYSHEFRYVSEFKNGEQTFHRNY